MAVTYVSSSGYGVGTLGSSTLPVPKPTGLQAGDLMLGFIHSDGATVTAPSGWTMHAGSLGATNRLFWKVATSDDAAASTFTFSRSDILGVAYCTIAVLRGVHQTAPIEAAAGASINASATIALPSVTAANAKYLFSMVATTGNPTGYAPPAPQAESYDFSTQGQAARTAGGYDTSPVPAGATGTRTWATPDSNNHRGYNILVISGLHAGSGSTSGSSQVAGTGARASSGTGGTSAAVALGATGSNPRAGSGAATAATATSGNGSTTRHGTGLLSVTSTTTGTGEAPTALASGEGALVLTYASSGSGIRPPQGSGSVVADLAVAGSGARTPVSSGALAATTATTGAGARASIGTGSLATTAATTGAGTNAEFRDITITARLLGAPHMAAITPRRHSAVAAAAHHSAVLVGGQHAAQVAPPRHSARIEDA